MSGYKLFTLAVALVVVHFCNGQNLELVENKGQWNPAVKFKGELMNGAFFLGQHGYKVLQQNNDDLIKIHDMVHGHHENNTATTTNSAKTTAAKTVSGPITAIDDSVTLHAHAYEVTFDQSNSNPEIIPEKPQIGYNNYITGSASGKQQGGQCKIYGGVMYKNMYPGIDVRYYSNRGNLKYDIIVQPNADISKLALKYEGTDGLYIKNNELIIKTSVGILTEKFPYSYQLVDGIRTQVGCKFKVYGNIVKYELDKYDHSKTLIIDPTLVFCSFTGSSADNWGYTATYGPDGSMFGGGIVFGAGYPISTGAYQTTFGGGSTTTGEGAGYDIGIIKLSADGTKRIYATYIGGSGNEAPHSMVTDAQGNLIVAGRTTSKNFPTTTANIGPTPGNGDWDIVLFKLSADGSTLLGSVKVGGSGDDGVNIKNKYANLYGVNGAQAISLQQNYGDDSRSEVILNGNSVFLSSCSQSTDLTFSGIPNSAQPTKNPGLVNGRQNQDGLLLQFDANLTTLVYGSFIGGSQDDAAYVLSASPITGNIFVGGATSSKDMPGDHSGTIGPSFTTSGTIEGFVNEYSPTGTLLKAAYVGPTANNGNTQVYGLKFDRFGFPYIMGTTTGDFTLINSAFGENGGKEFIGKLQKDLSGYVYFTAFGNGGSKPNISPIAFLVDRCENVYLSGWGGDIFAGETPQPFPNSGVAGLPITPDAIQSTTDNRDLYFFVLKKDAVSQLYGTFFGQNGGFTDHVDGGTSRFDEAGIIYQAICANCGYKATFPTTPGVWGPVNRGTDCNEAMVKIAFNFSGVHSGVKASISYDGDTTGCVPLTINFRDTIALAQSYTWNFGDGSPISTTLTPNISHTYNSLGTFTVQLIATDTTKCFPYDTTYTHVRIRADSSTIQAIATKLPPCTSTTYSFTNTSIPYAKKFGNTSFLWIWGDNSANVVAPQSPPITHAFPGIGTYNVKLVLQDTNFCNSPDTFFLPVRISPNVKASVSTSLSGCAPYNAVFNNTSQGGTSFFWDFGDGNTSTAINPTELYPTPGIYTVKLIAIDTSSCNFIDSTTFTITVSGKPTSAFSYSPNPPQQNVITTFTNLSVDATHYKWLYGDGDTLLTFLLDTTVRHIYNETKLYQPCLVAINEYNCPDTSCQSLNAIVSAIVDVPNAFTPNNDGVNDKAIVVGIGITKMDFKIYNRLGELVFETNDYKQGWNGIYKGKPQPMDAYGYTLDAQFFDGKSVKKSGSITLLR